VEFFILFFFGGLLGDTVLDLFLVLCRAFPIDFPRVLFFQTFYASSLVFEYNFQLFRPDILGLMTSYALSPRGLSRFEIRVLI
jgi:hypothetical protein